MKFTTKQKLFIKHYILTNNATESAIKAGYSNKAASVAGYRLLKTDKICSEIERLTKEAGKLLEITVEEIVHELRKISKEASSTSDKIRSLELLGKYLGMWKEQSVNVAVFSDMVGQELVNTLTTANERLKSIDVIPSDSKS